MQARRAAVIALAITLVLTSAASGLAQSPQPAGGARTALIVIDIQNFYFPGGRLPLVGPAEAAAQARKVIDACRAKKIPVIHVRHVPLSPAGLDADPAYAIRPEVGPLPAETVVTKHYANSFRETPLLDVLRKLGAERLIICGMQTHMCVEAAVRAAADYGFTVVVPHEACATRDLAFEGTTIPAAQVHAAALAAMNGSYARVIGVEALIAELR